ncbi:MAG: hypothetical protein AB1646_13970 [Thermodesulfobacteriota bacterium]
MKTSESTMGRASTRLGTLMFLGLSLVLGLAGFVLLSALAYAMVTQNLALGVVCTLLLFAPSVLGIAWAVTTAVASVPDYSWSPSGGEVREESRP